MTTRRKTKSKSIAHKNMRRWRRSPYDFVVENFDVTPDEWQASVLRALPINPKVAMSACKGPGKSCVMAWCGWWLLACHRDAKGIACSITEANLKDNLWTELATWYAKCTWLQESFVVNSERISSKERPKTWWLSARSFPQNADKTQQANTLAGLHAKTVFALLDELGDYPDGVLVAAEGIFANEHVDKAWLIVAGNPTQTDGPLHRITQEEPHLWNIICITGDPEDPQRSPRISLKWAQEHIDRWGRDNAWVRVNVLGLEPLTGSNKLLGTQQVAEAMNRDVPGLAYLTDPIIWGVDPARYGDDEACLMRRQGVVARTCDKLVWRGLDGPQLAAEIAKELLETEKHGHQPDAIFIDQGGVGASCFDHLKLLGWDDIIHGVNFGGVASDLRFGDKSSEMWWHMAEWVKKVGCLPNDPALRQQLTQRDLRYKMKNKRAVLQLQSKEEMRKLGIVSPDRADALALTFHSPVAKLARDERQKMFEKMGRGSQCDTEYELYTR